VLQKIVTGVILGIICAISGFLIADQIPYFDKFWWSGYVGAAAGLAIALLTLGLEHFIKRIPLKTIVQLPV
jgi:predicted acyltransferase